MLPHMTDDIVRHHCFQAIGKVASHPRSPFGIRREQCCVDGDCKVLAIHDVSHAAQTVLPALTPRRWVQRRDKKVDARGCEIDTRPVNNPPTLLARLQSLTTVGNSLKYFRSRRAPPTGKSAA